MKQPTSDSGPWRPVAELCRVALRAPSGQMRGATTTAMLPHRRGVATWQMARCRRNPLGAGGGGPQVLSLVGHDEKTAPAASVVNLGGRSSLRACAPKTPAGDPAEFCHGLLTHPRQTRSTWTPAQIFDQLVSFSRVANPSLGFFPSLDENVGIVHEVGNPELRNTGLTCSS